MSKSNLLILGLLLLVVAGCSSDDDNSGNGPTGSGSVALTVVSVSPSEGATGISINSSVTAVFSREIDSKTVTPASFYIEGVTGTVSTDTKSATFTASDPLTANTSYTITIAHTVAATDGKSLGQAYSADFTTGVAPVFSAGPDQDASIGGTVTLQGSSNVGSSATYGWTQLNGPPVTLSTGPTPSFTAPDAVSTILFAMIVDDGFGPSAPDTVVVFVLEDHTQTVWVSSSGMDSNPGTRQAPMMTIQAAIDSAASAGMGADLYIASGTYMESLILAENVSVYGGYTEGSWLRDSDQHTTIIEGGTQAVVGNKAHNVVLDGIEVRSADATILGQSSVAVTFVHSSKVVISNTVLTAGNGLAGANGTSPSRPGRSGTGGNGMGSGSCFTTRVGGNGAGGNGYRGGRGGNGGAAGGANGAGGQGPAGGGGSGGFASGGSGGGAGGKGPAGANATVGGSEFGSVNTAGLYTTANGNAGAYGGFGGGGGGGGGGAGSLLGCGGGGGGGGAGGYKGPGGTSGKGGGGSFGIILADTTDAQVVGNTINTAMGGNGGYGGTGTRGGAGGLRGSGGGSSSGGWAGGRGGTGGEGGGGGLGSGGGGGPSIGIVEQASTSFQDRLTFNLGQAGVGVPRPDSKGTKGTDGLVAEIKKIQ